MKNQNLLEQLNDKQKEAVTQTEGPVLVLAGAGSGKTRALTFRAAYLVKEKNIAPRNILAVTFTNKAAGEMRERIKEILGLPPHISAFSAALPHLGTFHSICVKILRQEAEKIGFSRNFLIYDDQDQLAMIKKVMQEMEVSQDQIKPKAVLGTMSKAKSSLIDAEEFRKSAGSYFEELVGKCYENYQARLKKSDALDFDDIIMLTVKIFRDYPEVLDKYQEIFRYIMVDEYQDTNYSQYMFLKMLGDKYRNIYVVGDDWQSVYGWRAADIRNILNFEKDYPEAKVVLLDQNYRSTQNILDAAQCIIEKNKNQKKKKLWTQNDEGELLAVREVKDEKKEARFIAEEIERLKKEQKIPFGDFAVLYRTNAQSRAVEEAFLKKGIPYRVVGGVKFYQRKEVKDILAYLYFLHNPNDEVSFERVVNLPARGIGKKTIEKIIKIFQKGSDNLIDTLKKQEILLSAGLNQGKAKILGDFAKVLEDMKTKKEKLPVSELLDFIYEKSGYQAMLAKEGEEGKARQENIKELLTVAKKFDKNQEAGVENFLEEIALVSQTDRDLEGEDSVPLMTMHSAKGLEFKRVFLTGLEEGLFPHSRATMNEKEMEEERRLCYVAVTRAKEKAYLLFTQQRNIYGTTQSSIKSRFLEEIDKGLIEEDYFSEEEDFSEEFYQEESIEVNEELFQTGDKSEKFNDGDQVTHPDFGKGIVISQDENLATIAFPGIGLKKLSKKVAPLRKA
jgi:DNA helicase-2/ATP-dependent DNA helicase PcrA